MKVFENIVVGFFFILIVILGTQLALLPLTLPVFIWETTNNLGYTLIAGVPFLLILCLLVGYSINKNE